MITEAAFLKFGDLTDNLKYAEDLQDSQVDDNQAMTDENLSDVISLRHMQTFKSSVSKATVLKSMMTRKECKNDSRFQAKKPFLSPDRGIKLGPGKSLTMHSNDLAPKFQNSEYVKKS